MSVTHCGDYPGLPFLAWQIAMHSPARPGSLPSCFFLLQEFEFACQMVIPLPAAGVLVRQDSPFRLSHLHNDLFAQTRRYAQNIIRGISTMPGVKFFSCLDFERKSLFSKRLGYLRNSLLLVNSEFRQGTHPVCRGGSRSLQRRKG
jgi:hypothetical protein